METALEDLKKLHVSAKSRINAAGDFEPGGDASAPGFSSNSVLSESNEMRATELPGQVRAKQRLGTRSEQQVRRSQTATGN
jgi:hypothetical protein